MERVGEKKRKKKKKQAAKRCRLSKVKANLVLEVVVNVDLQGCVLAQAQVVRMVRSLAAEASDMKMRNKKKQQFFMKIYL